MIFWLTFCFTLAACVALFLLPHHRREPSSFKAVSLAQIYAQFFRGFPEMALRRAPPLLPMALAGLFACLEPVLVVLALGLMQTSHTLRSCLALSGLLTLAGGVINIFLMLLSQVNFGWGSSTSTGKQTPIFYLIPVIQLFSTVVALVAAFSSSAFGWLHSVLSQP